MTKGGQTMKQILITLFLGLLVLTSCGAPEPGLPEPTNTALPPPTNTPLPTDTPPPPTATLDPILFFDDFNGAVDGAWTWLNEDPERWMVAEGGWLAITADNPSVLASGPEIEQVNLLTQSAPEGDFVITTRLVANPDENFQQAGIFLILDGVNYVSILDGICTFCLPDDGGYGVFMEGFKDNEPIAQGRVSPRAPGETDLFLRLVYSASQNTVEGYFAVTPDSWQPVGVVEGVPAFKSVGLGAANAPGPEGSQEDLTALFDYFEISREGTPCREGSPPPQPTPTLEPTPVPSPTPLPEGTLFRDDFEGSLQPGWTWLNEDPERWSYTGDGWLQIIGSNPSFFQEGDQIGLVNFLTRDLPEGEFMITAHIKADPNEDFQQATIFIYQDRSNYIALNTGFCSMCPTGGAGFYMETFIDNNPFGNAYHIPRDPEDKDVYLRLVNEGGSITGYYATSPGEWQRAGAFGDYFDFNLVGLSATNSRPWEGNDIIALFDYFEISIPEPMPNP